MWHATFLLRIIAAKQSGVRPHFSPSYDMGRRWRIKHSLDSQVCNATFGIIAVEQTGVGPLNHRPAMGKLWRSIPSISAPVTDKDVNFFWWFMCIFWENYFSSHSGQTAPYPLFTGQPLNIKIAVERPILKLSKPNFMTNYYFLW